MLPESFKKPTRGGKGFAMGNDCSMCIEKTMKGAAGAQATGDGFSKLDLEKALREALEEGVKFACEQASKAGGFNGNPAIHIPFPPECQDCLDKLNKIPATRALTEAVVKKLNDAAEQAAGKCVTILVNAITGMSASDAENIIKGGNGSCTRYLINSCREPIKNEMGPVVRECLEACGVVMAWLAVKTAYGKIPSVPLQIMGRTNYRKRKPIPDDLGEYAIGKAADGIFFLCEEKENKIRGDVAEAASELVRKVFSFYK